MFMPSLRLMVLGPSLPPLPYVVLGPRDPKPPALELHVESVNSSPENIHHAENDRADLTYDHKDQTLRFTVKKHPKKL